MTCSTSHLVLVVIAIVSGLGISALTLMYLDGWFQAWRFEARKGPMTSFDMHVMHETGLSWYKVCENRHYGTLPKVKRL